MDKVTRREFITDSVLAATLLAGINSAQATRADERPNRSRKIGANDKIHVACIGLNGRGKDHVMGYLGQPDVEIVALCDIDSRIIPFPTKMIERANKPTPKYYQDIRKLLEDKNVDVVSIATPNHWHSLAAIWAMQAGKDVYVEKPVSHNITEGKRMVQFARHLGRICQAGTQIRSMKGSQDAIAYIHAGKIGKVMVARGLCYKTRNSIGHREDAPVPQGVDYDIWLGPAPTRPFNPNRFHYNWHWNWDYGNGDLGNQGIHQMDVARWALNKDMFPKAVIGLGGRFGYEDDGQTPNTELTFFDYGDSQLVFEVRGLRTDPLKGAKVGNIIHGVEGTVVFTGYSNAIALDSNNNIVAKFDGGGDHFRNFLDAVRSRKVEEQHADIQEGYLSTALCHLGNISYRLGEPQPFNTKTKAFGDNTEAYETFGRFEKHLADNGIKLEETTYYLGPRLSINSKGEHFEHSPQANAMLTREYRKPFAVPAKV